MQQPAFGGRGGGDRRPALARILQQGQSVVPRVQGLERVQLVNQPADMSEANTYAQLGRAIDAAWQAAGTYLASERNRKSLELQELEKVKAVQDRASRRQATIDAQTDFAEFMEQLANDPSLGPGADIEDLSEWVAAKIADRVADFPEEYQNAYSEFWLVNGTGSLAKFRIEQKESAQATLLTTYQEQGFSDVRTADDMAGMIKELTDVGIKEETAWAQVALPLLKQLALAGDRERFDQVRSALGTRFGLEQQVAEVQLERTIASNESDRQNGEIQTYYDAVNSGRPFDEIETMVREMDIPERNRTTLLDDLDSRRRTAGGRTTEERVRLFKNAAIAEIVAANRPMFDEGSGRLITDQTVTLPDGRPVTITSDEIVAAAYQDFTKRIASRIVADEDLTDEERATGRMNSSRPPGSITVTEARTLVDQFAASHAYVTPEDEQILSNGLAGVSRLGTDPNGEVPVITQAAFDRFRQIDAIDAVYARKAVGGAEAYEQYRLLELIARTRFNGNLNQAAFELRAINENPTPVSIKDTDFLEGTQWLDDGPWFSTPFNAGEARASVRARTRYYMSKNFDQADAMKLAREDWEKQWEQHKGVWVPRALGVPRDYGLIAEKFMIEFLVAGGADAADARSRARDLVMIPDKEGRGQFTIRNKRTREVERNDAGQIRVFSIEEFNQAQAVLDDARKNKRAEEVSVDMYYGRVRRGLIRNGRIAGISIPLGIIPGSIDATRDSQTVERIAKEVARNPEAPWAQALLQSCAANPGVPFNAARDRISPYFAGQSELTPVDQSVQDAVETGAEAAVDATEWAWQRIKGEAKAVWGGWQAIERYARDLFR